MQNQECEQKKIQVCQQWHAKTSMSMKRYKIPTGTPRRHICGSVLAGGGVGADGGDDEGGLGAGNGVEDGGDVGGDSQRDGAGGGLLASGAPAGASP